MMYFRGPRNVDPRPRARKGNLHVDLKKLQNRAREYARALPPIIQSSNSATGLRIATVGRGGGGFFLHPLLFCGYKVNVISCRRDGFVIRADDRDSAPASGRTLALSASKVTLLAVLEAIKRNIYIFPIARISRISRVVANRDNRTLESRLNRARAKRRN